MVKQTKTKPQEKGKDNRIAKAAKDPQQVKKKPAAAPAVKFTKEQAYAANAAQKLRTRRIKAIKAKQAVKRGKIEKKRPIRTSVKFNLPKTVQLARTPKYPRKSVPGKSPLNQYTILKYPLGTEHAMKNIEDNRTLVFIVDIRANKTQIKECVKKMYDIKAESVNTLIRPDGKKKAYIKLTKDVDALDVANKIGII